MDKPTQVQVQPEQIYQLPEEHRIALVIGLNRKEYDVLVADAAARILARFPESGIQLEDLQEAMKSRIEALVGYNSQPPETYKRRGVDLEDDRLESLFGTGRFITGTEMLWGFQHPTGTQAKSSGANFARLEALLITSRFLERTGLSERAIPLMEEYGRVTATHATDYHLGQKS